MNDSNSHINFSAATIERYHKGLLSPGERHALEKAALDDPFLADALEGYQYTDTPAADLSSLKAQLEAKLNSGAKVVSLKAGQPGRSFSWWKAAAMVILLAGAGWLTYQFAFSKTDNQLAKTEESKKDAEPGSAVVEKKQETAATDTGFIQPVSPGQKKIINTTETVREENTPANATGPAGGVANEPETVVKETDYKAEDAAPVRSETRDLKTTEVAAMKKAEQAEPASPKPILSAPGNPNQGVVFNDLIKTEQNREETKQLSRKAADNNVTANQRNMAAINNRAYNFNGRVMDANNNALPFANVTNLNDNVGTYADARGNFTLISADSVLNVQARSVGFETRNYTLQQNNYRQNQIVLQDDRSQKDEYVSNAKNVKVNAEKLKERGSMKDETPEPADGWSNYNTYVANNIELPENIRGRQSGEVEVSFDVDKSGNPVNIQITKSLCKECDAEVIRLVKQGPKWKRSSRKGNKATVTVSF